MIVVADTSPLNYLLRLEKVFILQALYGNIVLPVGVAQELSMPGAPTPVRSWIAKPPSWITIAQIRSVDSTLPQRLGKGEREALSLAVEENATRVLLDDYPARLAARQRNLTVSGTLTILATAHALGMLDLPTEVNKLLSMKFRASASLIASVLAQASKIP